MKKLILLFIILGIISSCSPNPSVSNQDGIIVTRVLYRDQTYAEYYGYSTPSTIINGTWFIIDTIGKFNIGDTLNIVKLH